MMTENLMSRTITTCRPETDLETAAKMMWEGDFGVLPVVDQKEKIQGVITDRDICIALAAKRKPAADLRVSEIMKGAVYAVHMQDDIHEALKQMKEHRVRRLPVLGADEKIQGMISINDIILDTQEKGEEHPNYQETIEVMKSICAHRPRKVESEERPLLHS